MCGDPGQAARISIGSATSPGTGDTASDGTIKPTMHGTLVYQMVWTGVPCAPSGPATTNRDSAAGGDRCTFVAWVDAHSGQNLYGMSGPGVGPN